MKKTYNILPCSRCGASGGIEEYNSEDRYWRRELTCRVECSKGHAWDEWWDTEEEAVAAWNERVESK